MTIAPLRRSSSRSSSRITEISPESQENLKNSDRISSKTDLPSQKKPKRIIKISNSAL
jgi:hypothetical protein